MSYPESDNPPVFIAIDGDHVGESVESLVVRSKLDELASFSKGVSRLFSELQGHLEQNGARVYFSGGDNLLASLPLRDFTSDLLQELPSGPCTFSVGIGWDSRTALMALKVAKAFGRNTVFSMLDEYQLLRHSG